jgi:hypothetical protein
MPPINRRHDWIETRLAGIIGYPDLSVACGEAQFADTHFDTLLNPVLRKVDRLRAVL